MKSDIPFGAQFSPNQVELRSLLKICQENEGDREKITQEILKSFFQNKGQDDYNRKKLAGNTFLALKAYKIIDEKGNLTEVGRKLAEIESEEDLYSAFAKHILLELRGLDLIQTSKDMQVHAEPFCLVSFRRWLLERGVKVPRGVSHMSSMRLWLEKAGVVTSSGWDTDTEKLQRTLGTSTEGVDELASLSEEQKTFLKTMANLGIAKPTPSNEIEKLASQLYGTQFNEKELPKRVLYPLQEKGFIKVVKQTEGRGAKPFLVSPTEKLDKTVVAPLLDALEKQVGSHIRVLLQKPLTQIIKEVASNDKYIKGLALEGLAFHIMRLIDLTYIATRLRGTATGGAEVDLILEGTRFIFSRWQIQCKNTKYVALDDVAKEVGLTMQLKSNVVMVVTTGQISSEAVRYSKKVMEDTNINIIFLNNKDLELLSSQPSSIHKLLEREALKAMQIKKLEIK